MVDAESPSLREWRQGSILSQSTALALQLISAEDAEDAEDAGDAEAHCVVVVSHDCDIINSRHEPVVEVIRGRIINTADGSLTGGKSSRKLHLNWKHRGDVRYAELCASEKRCIPKSGLVKALPDANYLLAELDRWTLRFWLGARYNRSAFPDEFNTRLRNTKAGGDLVKILKPLGSLVTGVYVLLDTQQELLSENPTPPYRASLFLTFEPANEPLDSAARADAAANEIADAFANRCFDKSIEQWNWIELRDCVAVSEDEMTVSQAKRLQQLSLEYLSLRSNPQGVTPLGVRIA